jgi:hypothetical protein
LNIDEISLVGKPATGIQFTFTKSEDDPDDSVPGFELVDIEYEGTPEQIAAKVAEEARRLAEAG